VVVVLVRVLRRRAGTAAAARFGDRGLRRGTAAAGRGLGLRRGAAAAGRSFLLRDDRETLAAHFAPPLTKGSRRPFFPCPCPCPCPCPASCPFPCACPSPWPGP